METFSASLSVCDGVPDSNVHVVNMGPIRVLSAPDGSNVCPMNLAIRGVYHSTSCLLS